MFWFMVAALVVVVAAVALVVLGAGGSLPEAVSDRTPQRVPEDRPLTRHDLDGVRFAVAPRGYRMDEVDELLDRLGAELEVKEARLRAAERALTERPPGAATRGSTAVRPDFPGSGAGAAPPEPA